VCCYCSISTSSDKRVIKGFQALESFNFFVNIISGMIGADFSVTYLFWTNKEILEFIQFWPDAG